MKGFKQFVTEDEDVSKTLAKLPAHHRELLKGYKFLFEPHNTLQGDDGHVGMIVNQPKKIIRIAAPWNYGREFTVLHEIAHIIYEMFVRGTELEQAWAKLALSEPNRKKDEPPEELWCHCYASMFVKYPPMIHHHAEWVEFIKKICRMKKPLQKLSG